MPKKPMREIRELSQPLEIRAAEDGATIISGYAAVFPDGTDATQYRYYDVVETIKPGAFSRALKEKQDVRALYNHDSANLLGRVSAKTLVLSEDARGLRYEITLPNTRLGNDIAELVKRGDLTGSSFAFRVKSENWRKISGDGDAVTYQREILDVDLIDVGPVTFPAYAGTECNMRSEDYAEIEAKAKAACEAEANGNETGRDAEEQRRSDEAEALELQCDLLNIQ